MALNQWRRQSLEKKDYEINLIRNAVFLCALGASCVLMGCNNSGHEEGMKALRENTANPILQAEGLQPKPAKETATQ